MNWWKPLYLKSDKNKYTDLFVMSPRKVCILIASIFGYYGSWTKDFRISKKENAFKMLIMSIYVAFFHVSEFFNT